MRVAMITPEAAFITDSRATRAILNGLALDPVRRRLFADGHGVKTAYAYDLDAPLKAPVMSSEATGGAESSTLQQQGRRDLRLQSLRVHADDPRCGHACAEDGDPGHRDQSGRRFDRVGRFDLPLSFSRPKPTKRPVTRSSS